MKRVRLDNAALALALRVAAGENFDSATPVEELWAELESVGIALGVGELHPYWAEALTAVSQAHLVHHLASQYQDLVHLTDIFVEGQFTISVLRRQRINQDTGLVNGIDPQAELTVALGEQVWTLAKRTLPPFAEFTADPHQVPIDNEQVVELPESVITELAAAVSAGADLGTAFATAPGLPASVRDLLAADATLTCLTLVPSRDANQAGGLALMFWARGQDGFYRIASGERPGVFATQAGDVGFRLIWTTLGAIDHVALLAGGATR
jgi:hypothetical protein